MKNMIIFIITLLAITELCYGLQCWHCVADNCDEDPSNNYKASQKQCLDGQICQKVYFEMYSSIDHVKYISWVRSCADDCSSHNDFYNCSNDLYSTRGCIKRSCCSDEDLCNGSSNIHESLAFMMFGVLLVFVIL